MFRRLNQKKIVRHLTRFMHDRYLPDIKPNTPVKQKTIGVESPMKESRPKIDYTCNSSKYYNRNENCDLVYLIFKNKAK